MLFNSIEYLFIFVPIVFCIYFFLNKLKFYNFAKFFLLLASLYFYGSYKWDYVYIIIVSILFNYGISALFRLDISKFQKKLAIIFGVIGNIAILMFFKYFNFVIEMMKDYDWNHFNAMKIILPIGISFFILQQMSYIIDCYKETVKEYNLLDYSLFVCFFPQLIAGPIVRHQEMIPQFNNLKNRVINQENIFIGLFLITIGLLKKSVFSDGYIPFIDYMTEHEIYYNFCISWMLGISKLLQGFFDFSGYCDLALGSAFLFNISLPWNFNSPFKAVSITEFWKRWNMTLIRFLNDYVYKPLGGNHKGEVRTYANILITFTIMGIWLGFNILSFLYGLVNGIFIVINKLWDKLNIKMPKLLAVGLTFLSAIVATQILSVNNFHDLTTLLKSMLNIGTQYSTIYLRGLDVVFMPIEPIGLTINYVLFILSLVIVFFSKNSTQLAKLFAKSDNIIYTFIMAIVFIYATLSITKGSEFIYFAF